MSGNQRLRVLLAKPGLDGHDVGIKAVARALRDEGVEVIYMGLCVTPEVLVNAAIQESADVIGISCLSGSHLMLTEKIIKLLAENGGGHIHVVVGGTIPNADADALRKLGAKEVFSAGSSMTDIVEMFGKLAA